MCHVSQKVVSFFKAAAEAETFKPCSMLRVHAAGAKGAKLFQLKVLWKEDGRV